MSTAKDFKPQGNGFDRNRLRSLAPIVLFDVGGPLALYWLLRMAGTSEVTALIVSGILPAVGMALSIVKNRRIDAIGALVLLGIVTGTVLGLATHSARLVLMEGSVPTAIFGIGCLASLLTTKPMLQRIIEQATAGTAKGRMLMAKAAQPAGRRAFRIITLVWAVTLLAEAITRIGIVETMSTGTALLAVKVMPLLVLGALLRWTMHFAQRAVRPGEQLTGTTSPATTPARELAGAGLEP